MTAASLGTPSPALYRLSVGSGRVPAMTTRDEPWPPGTPSWADLTTSDREASWAFYRGVLGWQIEDTGEEYGHYGSATLEGRAVAGIGEAQPGAEAPVAWTTYLASDDVAATAAKVAESGGTVLIEPMEIPGQGTMLIAADPTGAAFGVWQSGAHHGAAIVNTDGAMVWNELHTPDPGTARAFYSAVFGHSYTPIPGAEEFDYTTIDGDGPGGTMGGLGEMAPGTEGVPPHWLTYFQVADTDATLKAAEAAGGRSLGGPHDSPYGRMATLQDPQGGIFAVIQPPPAT
jgi:predicted enzyme related to lactoylglutathione lyase